MLVRTDYLFIFNGNCLILAGKEFESVMSWIFRGIWRNQSSKKETRCFLFAVCAVKMSKINQLLPRQGYPEWLMPMLKIII